MKAKPTSQVVLDTTNFKSSATSRGFTYLVDTPIEKGGSNTGPTPVEYFLTAIASCVSITLRTYADKQGWDLGKITVTLKEHTKLTSDGMRKELVEQVHIEKKISSEQVKLLKEIAKTCPVAQMVLNPTNIINTLNTEVSTQSV